MNKRYVDNDGNFWNGKSIVIGEQRIWNPTEEQLSEAGYTEFVNPEPTEEQLLAQAKSAKLAAIESYDMSDAVNSFGMGGVSMWLTVEERQQIATQISVSEAAGRESMTRWFDGNSFSYPLATWKQMLVALELYAGDALNVTESHKAAVMAMETVAEVYDMKHPALWTIMMWVIAAVGYWLMATVGNVPVAFLYLASIVFVGAMPLIKGKHNTLHWICGITGCATSYLWRVLTCVTTESPCLSWPYGCAYGPCMQPSCCVRGSDTGASGWKYGAWQV